MKRRMEIWILFLSYLSVSSAKSFALGQKEVVDTSDPSDTVCYEDLGCITTDLLWYDVVHRPINLMPLARQIISTTFSLYTRQHKTEGIAISANDTSAFKAQSATKFIIHGFVSDGNEGWVKNMTTELLKHGDYNIIVVHWPGGAGPPYTRATANTRLVGLEIAHLINTLISDHQVKAEDFHLIGHSLGAHISGYAGEKIANLGRITGLDPAGPYFELLPTFVRLDPTDALFVDVIHTDGSTLGLGLMQPVGHLDFYPNGGENQPGCNLSSRLMAVLKNTSDVFGNFEELVACNHMRAIDLFIDSIFTICQPVAYECNSNDAFLKGYCISCGEDNTKCSRFGLDASMYPTRSRTNVQLYMVTGERAPFCRYHYAIELRLANPVEAARYVYGKLDFTLKGIKGLIDNAALTRSISTFVHGNTKRFLHVDNIYVNKINEVKLQWVYISDPLQTWIQCWNHSCNKKLYVNGTQISLLNNYPEKKRVDNTYNTCSSARPMCVILPKQYCDLIFRPDCAT